MCVCVSVSQSSAAYARTPDDKVKVFCHFILRSGVNEIPVILGYDTASCDMMDTGTCLVLLQ